MPLETDPVKIDQILFNSRKEIWTLEQEEGSAGPAPWPVILLRLAVSPFSLTHLALCPTPSRAPLLQAMGLPLGLMAGPTRLITMG